MRGKIKKVSDYFRSKGEVSLAKKLSKGRFYEASDLTVFINNNTKNMKVEDWDKIFDILNSDG